MINEYSNIVGKAWKRESREFQGFIVDLLWFNLYIYTIYLRDVTYLSSLLSGVVDFKFIWPGSYGLKCVFTLTGASCSQLLVYSLAAKKYKKIKFFNVTSERNFYIFSGIALLSAHSKQVSHLSIVRNFPLAWFLSIPWSVCTRFYSKICLNLLA